MPLIDLLRLRPTAFRHACESPQAAWWISGFLIATGAAYGTLIAAFQQAAGQPLYGIPVAQFSDRVLYGGNILAGLLIVVVVHTGATLIAWLMTRAVGGGRGDLLMLYRAVAYVMPLSAPALPLVAYSTLEDAGRRATGAPLDVLLVLGAVGGIAALFGLFLALSMSQALAPWRAAVAAGLTALFTGSILLVV